MINIINNFITHLCYIFSLVNTGLEISILDSFKYCKPIMIVSESEEFKNSTIFVYFSIISLKTKKSLI